MAFKAKEPEPIPGQDCKYFKPMFFSRSCCKLASKCNYVEQDFIEVGRFGEYCQGIKWDSVLDKDDPLQIAKRGRAKK